MLKNALLITVLLALFVVALYFNGDLLKIYKAFPEISKSLESLPRTAENFKKEISAPAPLRASTSAPAATLTSAGVIISTNLERKNNGALPALRENAKLNAAAEAKLKDMFKNQYFEHISPTGLGPGDLADNAAYQYIGVGENLALGNFASDKDLVTAWMNSPGHRANILNNKYQEIGVAVGKGMFEGRATWLAVQEFGFPLSACASPDTNLKISIGAYENQLDSLKDAAAALKSELETSDPKTREERKNYNQKVDEYNALVKQINALIDELKIMVANYNSEVQAFNLCAGN